MRDDNAAVTKPLHQKISEDLLRRVQSGEWRPGELLPGENALALEYSVSVGTARKAIEELAADRLLVRQRGRGTTVANHSYRQGLFHYYRLMSKDGLPVNQETVYLGVTSARASADEARALGIKRAAPVTRVRRFRLCQKQPIVLEHLTLREEILPGIGALVDAARPEVLYSLMEREFHVIISKVEEKVTAVLAGAEDTQILNIAAGAPMLQIERVAFDLKGRPIEFRIMRARNEAYYFSEVP